MKKLLSEVLIFSLTASLIACDVKSLPSETTANIEPSVSVTETTTEITETSVTVEVTEETVETVVRTQESIDAAWEARLDYETGDVPNIVIEGGPGLRNITSIRVTNSEYESLNNAVNDALVQVLGTESANRIKLERCDGRILSLSCNRVSYNFAVLEGKSISLSDVIDEKDIFLENLEPCILNSYELLAENDFNTQEYIDVEEVASYFKAIENIDDIKFMFTENALCLLYDYTAQNSSGNDLEMVFEIECPYMSFADLINPQFLPCDGTMLTRYSGDYLNSPNAYIPEEISDLSLPDSEFVGVVKISNYNGKDYLWVCIDFNRHEGDLGATDSDWIYHYPYVMLFDISNDDLLCIYSQQTEDLIFYPSYLIILDTLQASL